MPTNQWLGGRLRSGQITEYCSGVLDNYWHAQRLGWISERQWRQAKTECELYNVYKILEIETKQRGMAAWRWNGEGWVLRVSKGTGEFWGWGTAHHLHVETGSMMHTTSKFSRFYALNMSFPGGSMVKNLPTTRGNVGLIPELGRSLEKEMATHPSILAWETLWTKEPSEL